MPDNSIEIESTDRGLRVGSFTDDHGIECQIGESSAASKECLWLGRLSGVYKHGDIMPRMHLTRERCGELAELLQHFHDTGRLPLAPK